MVPLTALPRIKAATCKQLFCDFDYRNVQGLRLCKNWSRGQKCTVALREAFKLEIDVQNADINPATLLVPAMESKLGMRDA